MFKGFGLTGAAGLASGVVFLSVISGGALGILLIYLVPLPLMLIGLSAGPLQAVLAAALAAMVVAGTGMLHAVPSFIMVAAAPALILVAAALRRRQTIVEDGEGRAPAVVIDQWSSPGSVLATLTVCAVALMLAGAAIMAARGIDIQGLMHKHVADFLDQVTKGPMAAEAPPGMRDTLIGLWTALMPALACCAWLVIAVVNGVAAQWIVVKAERARRPTPSYLDMLLPWWVAAALAVAAGVGFLAPGNAGYVARNAAVVMVLPYTFCGLAVVHQMLRRTPARRLWLGLFYVSFVVLFQWALFAVAGLGLVRHWTRPRRQDARGQEEK